MAAAQSEQITRQLSSAEQRTLASFLSGRLPAGQLDSELAKARQAQLQPRLLVPPVPLVAQAAA